MIKMRQVKNIFEDTCQYRAGICKGKKSFIVWSALGFPHSILLRLKKKKNSFELSVLTIFLGLARKKLALCFPVIY